MTDSGATPSASTAALLQVADADGQGVVVCSGEEPRILAVNDTLQSRVGRDESALVGSQLRTIHPDRSYFDEWTTFVESLDSDDWHTVVGYHQRADGSTYPVHIDALVVADESVRSHVVLRTTPVSEGEQPDRAAMLERQFGALFEHPASFAALLAPDGTVLRVNETALDFIDSSLSDVQGAPFWETPWWTHSTELQSNLQEHIERAASGSFQRFEAEHIAPDGDRVVVDASLTPVESTERDVISIIAFGRDITEQKRREADLATFESVINTIDDGVYIADENQQFSLVNDALADLTGYEKAELLGADLSLILTEEGLQTSDEGREMLADSPDKTIRRELTVQTAGGDSIMCEFNGTARSTSPDGDVVTVGVVRDITEQKRRERHRKRVNDLLARTQELADVGGWELDVESEQLTWTAQVNRIHGKPVEYSPTLEDAIEFYHPDDRETIQQAVQNTLQEGTPFDCTLRIITADDEVRWIRARGSRDSHSSGDKLRGTVQDVTEQHQRERALQQQNERLETFAQVVSHDLRNPLSLAMGYVEQLHEQYDPEYIAEVESAHERMERIIEGMLTLLDEGTIVSEREQVSLASLVWESWETTRTVEADLHIIDDLGTVYADAGSLQSLFENLFGNAVEHGGTDVTVRIGGTDDGFYVADSGPGLPEEMAEDLFSAGVTSDADGSGLGLAIVQRVVDGHDWEIEYSESADGGVRFDVSIH